MADVYDYIDSNGVIVPDTGDILAEVQNEYKITFGTDLNVNPQTPQGMLITSEALARVAVANNNATLANQINPNLAGGVFLDAILALSGIFRAVATPSTVLCTLTGVAGTSIPSGSQASETVNGAIFQLTTTTVIPPGGTISNVEFQSAVDGAIPASASTLTTIVSDVLGWETITNPADAVLGQATESDVAARNRRQVMLGLQGQSTAEAIISGLLSVEGVLSLSFRENVAATTQTIDGVVMVSHSIYACVDGGLDLPIAEMLTQKKSAGAAYNNGASMIPVSQPVVAPFSGQTIDVLFDRPDIIQILVRAHVSANTSVQNPISSTITAITDYANGNISGIQGLTVGQSVSPFELAGAVTGENPGIYVQKMEISLASSVSYVTVEIPMTLWQKAVIEASAITVIIV